MESLERWKRLQISGEEVLSDREFSSCSPQAADRERHSEVGRFRLRMPSRGLARDTT